MSAVAWRVAHGRRLQLADFDAADCGPFTSRDRAEGIIAEDLERLRSLQEHQHADGRFSVLLILQGMDTSGKDGTVRHLSGGINLLGSEVSAFGVPTEVERRHDFLWRVHRRVPARGVLGVFNRSHYEDVLVPVVEGRLSGRARVSRYHQINAFEQMLIENDTTVIKCFLHISKEQQKQRLQARLDERDKTWKFNPADLEARKHWPEYWKAYEALLSACSTAHAPWHIVPADHKWYRNYAVTRLLIEALQALPLRPPKPTFDPASVVIT